MQSSWQKIWQPRMPQNLLKRDPVLLIFCQHPGSKVFGFAGNGHRPNEVPVLYVPLRDLCRLGLERQLPKQQHLATDSSWSDVWFGIALTAYDNSLYFRRIKRMNLNWLKKSSDWNFHLFEKSLGWLSFSWIIEWNFCRFLSLPLELNNSSSSWHFRAFVQGNKSFKIKLLDQKIVCIYRLVFINTPIASGKALCNIF